MTSINDFATTYMCQSLPFGGVKESGFDRFAGIEGIRGMCIPKAVCEDRSILVSPLSPRSSSLVQISGAELLQMLVGHNLSQARPQSISSH